MNDASAVNTASEPFAATPLRFERKCEEAMRARAEELREEVTRRRTVRAFSEERIPLDVVRAAIDVASTAPSGANKQPVTFCLVTHPQLKRKIRIAAEHEERQFYSGRATEEWLEDLHPFGTGPDKPYLEAAPALIVVFAQARGAAGERHYYVKESVGIAVGMLIQTLHQCGLASLTHTPSPMHFLRELLQRPDNERPFVLMPVGYPCVDCHVPAIRRKERGEYLVEFE